MPRPVDPKSGQDGYEIEPADFVVSPQDVQPLLEFLEDRSEGLATRLTDNLLAIGTRHRRWKHRGAQAFSREEARKALDVLLKLSSITCASVTSLNERALHAVIDQLGLMTLLREPAGASITEMLYADRLDGRVLGLAASRARHEILKTKGPETDIGVMYCVFDLCALFEQLSGQPVTLSNRDEDRAYTQDARSRGARFVHGCYRLIDEDVLNHQLNGHIRGWLERPSPETPSEGGTH